LRLIPWGSSTPEHAESHKKQKQKQKNKKTKKQERPPPIINTISKHKQTKTLKFASHSQRLFYTILCKIDFWVWTVKTLRLISYFLKHYCFVVSSHVHTLLWALLITSNDCQLLKRMHIRACRIPHIQAFRLTHAHRLGSLELKF